jgi:prepilin peptidase CpaA
VGVIVLTLSIACAGIALLLAALSDVARRTIPNFIPIVVAIAFVAAICAAPASFDLWPAIFACVGVFGIGTAMFALNWLGGGDVKLLAAATLWSGIDMLDQLLLVTAVIGGAIGLLVWLWAGISRLCLPGAQLAATAPSVPYGVAIACGGMSVLATMMERSSGISWL